MSIIPQVSASRSSSSLPSFVLGVESAGSKIDAGYDITDLEARFARLFLDRIEPIHAYVEAQIKGVLSDCEDDAIDFQEQDDTISKILCLVGDNPQKLSDKLCGKIEAAGPSIECLTLTHKEITAVALSILASCFPNLSSLRINHSALAPSACPGLTHFSQLACLDVSYCKSVDDAVVKDVVAICPKVIDLRLRGVKITDAVSYSLSRLAELECLDLSDTSITDEALKRLTSSSINELRINGCRPRRSDHLTISMIFDQNYTPTGLAYVPFKVGGVTDIGFYHAVENLPELRKICIFNTQITDEAIERAKKYALEEGPIVLRVHNWRNHIFKDQERAIVLQRSPFKVAPKKLRKKMQRTSPFAIFKGKNFRDPVFVSNVFKLAKGNILLLMKGLKDEIDSCVPFIERLHFSDCLMTREKLLNIASHFTKLRQLSFTNVHITDFSVFTSFNKLTDLNLSHYPYPELSTQPFINAIQGCPRLRNLDLSYTAVDDETLFSLVYAKQLTHIDITGCVQISDETVRDAIDESEFLGASLTITGPEIGEHKQETAAKAITPIASPGSEPFEIFVENPDGVKEKLQFE